MEKALISLFVVSAHGFHHSDFAIRILLYKSSIALRTRSIKQQREDQERKRYEKEEENYRRKEGRCKQKNRKGAVKAPFLIGDPCFIQRFIDGI